MSPALALLDELYAAFDALRGALDGADAGAIDAAGRRVAAAAAAARAIDDGRSDPAVRERLGALRPLIEAARVRAYVLADHAGQHMALLARHGARTAPLTYGR
ncbi:MAG: hypothetical protein AB7E60_00625 [Sphingobium sp.]